MAKKYYVVEKGYEPGIYKKWDDCKLQVNGFKGAKFKKYKTIEEANIALTKGIDNVEKEEYKIIDKEIDKLNLIDIDYHSICVDGACSGNPGIGEYQCVDSVSKEVIFSSNKFKYTTNNLMEFFALVEAMIYIKNNNLTKSIYSDSATAITWVSKKRVNTTLKQTEENKDTFFLIKKYEEILKKNNFSNITILKWNTKKLGEIFADFGRK